MTDEEETAEAKQEREGGRRGRETQARAEQGREPRLQASGPRSDPAHILLHALTLVHPLGAAVYVSFLKNC